MPLASGNKNKLLAAYDFPLSANKNICNALALPYIIPLKSKERG